MIGAMVGAWVGELVTVEVSKALLSGVTSKLNPSDLDKAIKTATIEACKQETRLFYSCPPDFIPKFLCNFFKEQGLSELQKPLENEGKPDVDYLAVVFQKAALADSKMKEIKIDYVYSWMEVFVTTYFQNTDNCIRFQIAKENYLQQLVNWFDDVKFAGIAVPGQEVEKSEKLVNIFVLPEVQEDNHKDINNLNSSIETELLSSNLSQSQQQLLWEQRQRALRKSSGRKFLASQILSQTNCQKFVLLGAPGSGKTTLLSYFVVMLAQKQIEQLNITAADYLPIIIPIRDFARQANISVIEYVKQFVEKNLCVKTLPVGFFEYWLEDGHTFIFFDGLDEIAQENKRYDVVRKIENFLGQFPTNCAVITSRPAGYKRDFFNTQEFAHYELLSFDDEKIEKFINCWYNSRIQDKSEAERRKTTLREALNKNERLKLLARNPLLLTIIALIHRYQAVLPKGRHKLYEKAVETLLTSWDANKEINVNHFLQDIDIEDLLFLMRKLAFWIHGQGSTADKEGGTLIACEDLLDKLKREIKSLKEIELYKAEEKAKRFLSLIQERTGLLNEQGQDCYAFVHKTFQEYLCAREINYQADDQDDFDIVLQYIDQHLHDPHWREVLLLLITQQAPNKAATAIRKVLSKNSEYEQWLHRDLLFAGNCLAEDIKNLKTAKDSPAIEILQNLVNLEVSDSLQVSSQIKSQVFQILCSLNETAFQTQALQLLKEKEQQIEQVRFQKYRAALGEKKAAVDRLLELLKDSESNVRSSAANALGRIGTETAIPGLLELLKDSESNVRSSAANALGNIGTETAIPGLLELLKDSESNVRSSAAFALVRIGTEAAIPGLLELLKDSESNVRSSAAFALGIIGTEAAIPGLLELLKDSESNVRSSAAFALGRIGTEAAIPGLLELLKDSESNVRSSAADALGNIGTEVAIPGLLELLKDSESNVRSSAVNALVRIGTEAAIPGLLELLKDSESNVRSSAAFALGNIGTEAAIPGLLELLKDSESNVRSSAAFALGNIGTEAAIPSLLELLKDSESNVRSSAANALGNIGTEAAIPSLLELLKGSELNVRSSAAFALGNIGKEAAIPGLLELLKDSEFNVRLIGAFVLKKIDEKTHSVVINLSRWINENQDSEYIGDGIDLLWELICGETT
ncbi:Predicted signal transduction protein containing Nacht domain [Trichormus variabilis ATCC 29413]|uniref:Predicted signal transduction protein containing Nacht domain n=2 Tax=Anabaena variabilis TaxID=264691 RepID=Q3M7C1_TRIV2|nr:Predicted signal transduction protein containing Nacht domain [Trichormus variabilis ATCC 29413]